MAGITDALSPISLGLSGAQTALGIYQQIAGNAKMKKLLAQRKSYQTPDEIFQMVNALQNNVQPDAAAYSFLTNRIDRARDASLGTAERLGANPNDLSGILDQSIQGLMQVGDKFTDDNMKKFYSYMQGLSTLADNKAAEWKSEQDILKDKIQAAGGQAQAGASNISGGINNVVSTLSSDKISKLYKEMVGSNSPEEQAKIIEGFRSQYQRTDANQYFSNVLKTPNARSLNTTTIGERSTGNPYITALIEANKVNGQNTTAWGTNW